MLAFDSHNGFTSPDRYYMCSLATPFSHVVGATLPGVPGIIAGRNDDIAWGATVMHADTQDLVIEQLSPQFPGKYKVPGGWDMMKENSEDIAVRLVAHTLFAHCPPNMAVCCCKMKTPPSL